MILVQVIVKLASIVYPYAPLIVVPSIVIITCVFFLAWKRLLGSQGTAGAIALWGLIILLLFADSLVIIGENQAQASIDRIPITSCETVQTGDGRKPVDVCTMPDGSRCVFTVGGAISCYWLGGAVPTQEAVNR